MRKTKEYEKLGNSMEGINTIKNE